MPGCTLYMWTGHKYQGHHNPVTGFIFSNGFGNEPKDKTLGPGPTSAICECGHQAVSCEPSDGWETIVTCDNTGGEEPTKCTYSLTVGTQRTTTSTKETDVSL